jgi:integrase
MADIDDRWMRAVKGEDGRPVLDAKGKAVLERTERWGKGKRYLARYRGPDGRQKSPAFDTIREANDHLAQVRTDANRGQYIDHKAGRIKVRKIADQWLASMTSDPASQYQVALRVRAHILPHFGDYEVRAVTPADVQKWMRKLQDGGTADNYIRVIAGHLSSIMLIAQARGLIAKNPVRDKEVRQPEKETRRVVPWSPDWVSGMRAELPDYYSELVSVGAGLGLRQGEAFGLSPEDINVRDRVVHVRRQVKTLNGSTFFALPKRGKTRDVPLPDLVAERLKQHMEAHPPTLLARPWGRSSGKVVEVSLIFTTRISTPIQRDHFMRGAWVSARERVEIPAGRENGFHALRHYYASRVLAGGASIRDLASWLGHQNAGFTLEVYSHMLPDSADKMRAAIESAL